MTIFVDAANAGDPGQDGSPAHPWALLSNGVWQLYAENQVSSGGHSVVIAPGDHFCNMSLTNRISGSHLADNVFVCTNTTGRARIIGGFWCNVVGNIRFQNIDFAEGNYAIYGFGGTCMTFDRCNIYANRADGIYTRNYSIMTLESCNIYANGGYGICQEYCESVLENCNIVGNGIGVCEQDYRKNVVLRNCNVYGNGTDVIENGSNIVAGGEADLNSYPENTDCIMRNPGFSDLANNWNFDEFYANSPCYGAGAGGVDIGVFQGAPSVPISSNTYYVAPGGDDTRSRGEASTPSTPWATIVKAASCAVAGDTVVVESGAYMGQVTITNSAGQGCPLLFEARGDVSIDGDACGIVLDRVSNVELSGFKIVSCVNTSLSVYGGFGNLLTDISCSNAGNAGIVLVKANHTGVTGCTAASCGTYGIYHYACGALVLSCSAVAGNTYGYYSAGYTHVSTNYISRSSFHENSAYGMELFHTTADVRNCNIYSNGTIGIRVWNSSPLIFNCDIIGNGDDGLHNRYQYPQLINCIVAGNGVYGVDEESGAYHVYVSNTCFHANTTGNYYDMTSTTALNTSEQINALDECGNCIVVDPLFRNPGVSDYRLRGSSPCSDAGVPVPDLDMDFYGNPRPVAGFWDIGSYEMPCAGSVFVFTGK